ncbi:MAG: DDE-type integrase/transposase/recombinase [Nannocystis sp.]|nr:DDE-type integrase/transposase/recombinase [Nannocystis sp.]
MQDLSKRTGLRRACEALGLARATVYRRRRETPAPRGGPRRSPERALDAAERATVLDLLHSEECVDKAPEAIVAILLTRGRWVCSARTMYRILAEEGEVRERRSQRRHPAYKRPELMATAPNQAWSWDVTWLRGPVPGVYFYLYVVLDIYSRCVIGWTLAGREDTTIAKNMMKEAYTKQGIEPDQLTIHADRGAVPTSRGLSELYRELGVRSSHSRPRVSDDNPFSEAHFKTVEVVRAADLLEVVAFERVEELGEGGALGYGEGVDEVAFGRCARETELEEIREVEQGFARGDAEGGALGRLGHWLGCRGYQG